LTSSIDFSASTRSANDGMSSAMSCRNRSIPRTRSCGSVPFLADQLGHLGPHPQGEGRFLLPGVGEQVEQIPLRHHRDVRTPHLQPAKVGDDHAAVHVDREGDLVQPALRQLGEPLTEAQLVKQLQGRRMHGVAAEVPQEVAVLLQHAHLDARPSQQQPEHHSGRSAPDDHTGRALGHPYRPLFNG